MSRPWPIRGPSRRCFPARSSPPGRRTRMRAHCSTPGSPSPWRPTATRARRTPRRCRSAVGRDRKSTRLNSSHSQISYAVFCFKNKLLAEVVIDAVDGVLRESLVQRLGESSGRLQVETKRLLDHDAAGAVAHVEYRGLQLDRAA